MAIVIGVTSKFWYVDKMKKKHFLQTRCQQSTKTMLVHPSQEIINTWKFWNYNQTDFSYIWRALTMPDL
jgi:hypothetical protein